MIKAGMLRTLLYLATAHFLTRKWKVIEIHPKGLFILLQNAFMINGIGLWRLIILLRKAGLNSINERQEARYLQMQGLVVASAFMVPGRMRIFRSIGIKT